MFQSIRFALRLASSAIMRTVNMKVRHFATPKNYNSTRKGVEDESISAARLDLVPLHLVGAGWEVRRLVRLWRVLTGHGKPLRFVRVSAEASVLWNGTLVLDSQMAPTMGSTSPKGWTSLLRCRRVWEATILPMAVHSHQWMDWVHCLDSRCQMRERKLTPGKSGGEKFQPEDLIVYSFGTNDLEVETPPLEIVQNWRMGLETLIENDGRSFLIPTLSATVSPDANVVNAQMEVAIAELEEQYPDLSIGVFDFNALIWEVVGNPAGFGFTTFDPACNGCSFSSGKSF